MRLRTLIIGMAVSLGLQAGIPAALGGNPASEDPLRQAGLRQYWEAELPLQRGDSVVAVHLLKDTLYVVTRRGDLHAVDPDVGLLRWTHSVATRGGRVFRPYHLTTVDGRAAVLVTHGKGAYVYARDSGAVLEEIANMWPAGSAAVGDALSLYAGGSDGFVYAVRWYDPVHRTPIHTWKVFSGGPVTSRPVLIDTVLHFASQSGRVFACSADWDKDLKWSFSTEAAIVADLCGDESGIYVACLNRSLYRLDVSSGVLRWRYRFPQPLRDAPIVSQRTVYQHCRGVGLYAIDVDTEDAREPLWILPSATAFVSRRADRTCVLMEDQNIAVVDSATGDVRSTIPMPRGSVVTNNPNSLTFYVVTAAGQAECFTSADVRHLLADDILKGLTPPGEAESGDDAEERESDAAEDTEDIADVDLDDPLRSRSDR